MEKKQVNYNVALYIRLSREDGDKEESESVTNQRKILRAFVKENNYNIFDEYVDDGYSGTNFDRPSFQRMLADCEKGLINAINIYLKILLIIFSEFLGGAVFLVKE